MGRRRGYVTAVTLHHRIAIVHLVQLPTLPVAGFLFMATIHSHTLTRKQETDTVILVQPVGQNIRSIT